MEKHFALIVDGIVENTVLANTKEIAENVTGKTCVEFTIVESGITENLPHIGLSYDAETGIFEQPPVVPPAETPPLPED